MKRYVTSIITDTVTQSHTHSILQLKPLNITGSLYFLVVNIIYTNKKYELVLCSNTI